MPITIKPFGPANATVMIVGEGPTRNDALAGHIFSGNSGKDLTKMLHEVGMLQTECYITSVCRQNIPGWDSKKYFIKHTKAYQVPKPEVTEGRELLLAEIASVKPNLIIALGELALWALTGESGITKWRGSILEMKFPAKPSPQACEFKPYKIIPTYAPEVVQRKYDWRFIAVQDLRRCEKESKFPDVNIPEYNFTIRPAFGETIRVLDNLLAIAQNLKANVRSGGVGVVDINPSDDPSENKPPQIDAQSVRIEGSQLILGGDIETRASHIACMGIAWNKTDAICIPFICVENHEGYWNEAEEIAIVQKLTELFKHPNVGWIFQNGIYDLQYFSRHWGVLPNMWMDTMLAHHTCWAGLPKGLDFISSLYCEYHRYWKDEGKEFHTSIKTPSDEEQYWVYNCKDCVTEYEAAFVILKVIKDLKQEEPYAFQMRQFPVVLRMMLRGVRIDRQRKNELAMELLEAIAPREQLINDIVGRPLNPKSPKQMQEFFYGELGLPKQINRKTKRPTTDSKALQALAHKEPLIAPLVQVIEEYRSLGVFLSTFIKAALDTDGRMRSSYNIAGTETYRWSSSKDAWGTGMNLQNIPKGTEE